MTQQSRLTRAGLARGIIQDSYNYCEDNKELVFITEGIPPNADGLHWIEDPIAHIERDCIKNIQLLLLSNSPHRRDYFKLFVKY